MANQVIIQTLEKFKEGERIDVYVENESFYGTLKEKNLTVERPNIKLIDYYNRNTPNLPTDIATIYLDEIDDIKPYTKE